MYFYLTNHLQMHVIRRKIVADTLLKASRGDGVGTMQLFCVLLSALASATLDFEKIVTVQPHDWSLPDGTKISTCTAALCRLTENPDQSKHTLVGLKFNSEILKGDDGTGIINTRSSFAEAEIALNFIDDQYTTYLAPLPGTFAYAGINFFVDDNDQEAPDKLLKELEKYYNKDNRDRKEMTVVVTIAHHQFKVLEDPAKMLDKVDKVAVVFQQEPNADLNLAGDNLVCIATQETAEKIRKGCGENVYIAKKEDHHGLPENVKHCAA